MKPIKLKDIKNAKARVNIGIKLLKEQQKNLALDAVDMLKDNKPPYVTVGVGTKKTQRKESYNKKVLDRIRGMS